MYLRPSVICSRCFGDRYCSLWWLRSQILDCHDAVNSSTLFQMTQWFLLYSPPTLPIRSGQPPPTTRTLPWLSERSITCWLLLDFVLDFFVCVHNFHLIVNDDRVFLHALLLKTTLVLFAATKKERGNHLGSSHNPKNLLCFLNERVQKTLYERASRGQK